MGKIMKKELLVIDDDKKLNELLTDYLTKFGFSVSTETHPARVLKTLKNSTPDLIILDIMLPGMDGFEVCRKIRQAYDIPIIMLTARGEVEDRIVGLELGADDYIPKPFEPRELVARIQSVLRRGMETTAPDRYEFKDLVVETDKQLVLLGGERIELTTMEFEILCLFVRNPGKVLDRDGIMESLRGLEWEAFDRSIDVLISRLRQKLNDDPKVPRYIRTVWGRGYKFIGEDHGNG
jgi:two-component system phosphate regulon response regulator OmpR